MEEVPNSTFGSWMNAPPLLLGGRSPVVAYLRHSIIVFKDLLVKIEREELLRLTVLPEPLYPTISVSGV